MSKGSQIASRLTNVARDLYKTQDFIPLHAPIFEGKEAAYVTETITSTFVSTVGAFVGRFEDDMAAFTGAQRAVAVVNGTAALQVGLHLVGVGIGDLVITQALSFVATCNAIAHCRAQPVFCDVDRATMGLSPDAVAAWLDDNATRANDGRARRKSDGAIIKACVPMHTFGHPMRITELQKLCADWGIAVVEDAAEGLGSTFQGQHAGTFGEVGTQSFNGNKILTTGGGGMILTNAEIGDRARHLTTTAKVPHAWNFDHDAVAWNFRMPNLNAALGVAQLEQLPIFIAAKRQIAASYAAALADVIEVQQEPADCQSNFWLNAVICEDQAMRDTLLEASNSAGVMTRPIWTLMSHLPMYSGCDKGPLDVSEFLSSRVVNIPSGVTVAMLK